ncbi:MAG: hypothetical protein ACE5JM_08315 [Armatimonadota bacterium]
MAHYTKSRYGYFELKADLAPKDAQILERLVARPAAAPEVVGDLVVNDGMTPSAAYSRIRSLLLKSMAKLDRSAT